MRRWIVAGALTLGVSAAWTVALPTWPAAQPLAFNHARHQGVTCRVCHEGVTSRARAGLPAGPVCARCHAAPPAGVDEGTWTGLQDGTVRWTAVTRVRHDVLFSHRRHVTLARLDCASCHGDIGTRTEPPARAPIRLDMADCRACHAREGAVDECLACHR